MKSISSLVVLCVALLMPPAQARAAVTNIPARPARVFCKALATTNITRSGPQPVDTVSLVAGDVACLTAESDNKNGPYVVQAGAWKAVDPGLGTGVELYAQGGSANVATIYGCDTSGLITWGTTSTTFTKKAAAGSVFSPSATGALAGVSSVSLTGGTLGTRLSYGTGAGGLTIQNLDTGARVYGFTTTSSATALTFVSYVPFTLANNGVIDTPSSGPGFVIISSGAIVGTVGYDVGWVTTLGGLTPTNLSVTLGTAAKINVANSGSSSIRIENKTGGSISGVAMFVGFGAS